MAIYGISEKVCATCMYWNGKRCVSSRYIDTNICIGKCRCTDSFNNIETLESSSCNAWKGLSSKKNI